MTATHPLLILQSWGVQSKEHLDQPIKPERERDGGIEGDGEREREKLTSREYFFSSL